MCFSILIPYKIQDEYMSNISKFYLYSFFISLSKTSLLLSSRDANVTIVTHSNLMGLPWNVWNQLHTWASCSHVLAPSLKHSINYKKANKALWKLKTDLLSLQPSISALRHAFVPFCYIVLKYGEVILIQRLNQMFYATLLNKQCN